MQSITPDRMKAIDTNCTHLGLKGIQLMENAGAAIARKVLSLDVHNNVLIVAGRGNNGGDAFVAARHLSYYDNIRARVILAGKASGIRTKDALENFNLLKHCGIKGLAEITDSTQSDVFQWFKEADVIVDGLLGTGIRGHVREPEATLIDAINTGNSYVVAVDTPSGLDPATGKGENTVMADTTLTFHRMKTGLENQGEFTGDVEVINIGVCRDAEDTVNRGDLEPLLKRRIDSHKGQSGRVLIIGGGRYSGAPALSAMAALRTGADIVTIASPANVSDTIASFSPNLIVRKLSSNLLHTNDIEILKDLIHAHDVVVIGMGLGNEETIHQAIHQILPLCKKVVADADALNELQLPPPENCEMILTPHPGEFARLTGKEVEKELPARAKMLHDFSRENKVITILKGKTDIISDGKYIRQNYSGNAGMSVGGTGDVLAGIVGALFCRTDAFNAACCGAFVNGEAGDVAFAKKGYGLLATDVIEHITDIMRQ